MEEPRNELSTYDRPCPLTFVVIALIASALLWLCAVAPTLLPR